MAFHPDKCNSK